MGAQSVHAAIRKWLRRTYGNEIADSIRIQYGGSVTPETVDALMKCPDIDGALVGGRHSKQNPLRELRNFKVELAVRGYEVTIFLHQYSLNLVTKLVTHGAWC